MYNNCSNNNLLCNKVSLVTGTSKGIGKSIVEVFAKNGATVYANARTNGSIDDYSKELSEQYGTKIIPLYFDINDKDAIKNAIMKIKSDVGRLDILVNNAGIMKDAYIEMVDDTTIFNIFNTNVFSMIHLTQMALKLMKRQKLGSIINMSSIVGLRGNNGETVYSASKGAVATLTKTWARELAKDNIRVNGLAPGKIDTNMLRSIGDEKIKEQINEVGFGRFGKPEEVANVALFLASDLSSYVTGEIIGVNGGWFL